MDGFGRLITIIIAGILIFMIPLGSLLTDYQGFAKNHVEEKTKEFANNVLESGYLNIKMYDNYLNILNQNDGIYQVELIHSVPTQGILGAYIETCPSYYGYQFVNNSNTSVCDKGHYYFLKPDGSDDGCLYCNDIDISKKLSQTYMDKTFTMDIIEEIYSNGIYYFSEGDYFTVNVEKANKGLASDLLKLFLLTDNTSDFSYGGIVNDKSF